MLERDFQDDLEMLLVSYHYQATMPPRITLSRILHIVKDWYPDLTFRELMELTVHHLEASDVIDCTNLRDINLTTDHWFNSRTRQEVSLNLKFSFNFDKPLDAWIWFLNDGPGAGEWYSSQAIASNIHTMQGCHFSIENLLGVRRHIPRLKDDQAGLIRINDDNDTKLYAGADPDHTPDTPR